MKDTMFLIKNSARKWHKFKLSHTILVIILIVKFILLFSYLLRDSILSSRKSQEYYYNLKLDRSSEPSEAVLAQRISKQLPYLPIEDILDSHSNQRHLNRSCAWHPTLDTLRIRNDFWQEFHVANISFHLFGAYLDNRPNLTEGKTVVRIIATMSDLLKDDSDYPRNIYCQFWYNSIDHPIIMQASAAMKMRYWAWHHRKEHNYGHMIVCPLPQNQTELLPNTVSLVAQLCDKATNVLRIVYEPLPEDETKKGFAVCVKNLDYPYPDVSNRFVEWLETVRVLGAEKVLMYDMHTIHPNVTKVLQYYQNTGFLEYRGFAISLDFANQPDIRHLQATNGGYDYAVHELIAYNDCIYRNMYRYQYFAVMDMDEIPMPLGNFSSWSDLTKYAETDKARTCNKFTSFCFRCTTFSDHFEIPVLDDDLPEFFHMLQHTRRQDSHAPEGYSTKCLHNGDHVIATHNHVPVLYNKKDTCSFYTFNTTVAQLNHYRKSDPKNIQLKENTTIDTSLWRFKSEIVERSMKVFDQLGFLERIPVDSTV